MKILVVSQDFPPLTGGIQSYMGSLSEHLLSRCEALSVVAPGGPSERSSDSVRPFPVHRINFHSSWLVAPLLLQLPKIVARTGASHVLYAQWFPAVAGLRLPPQIKQACIVHGRELLNHPLGPIGLRLAPRVLVRMDALFPNSKATANLLPAGLAQERIHVVHPGVDCGRLSPPTDEDLARFRSRQNLAPNAPVVTTLARLVQRKGIDTLIQAVASLQASHPHARLLIGGSGPDRSRLERLVAEAGLGDSVRFVGRIPTEDMSAFFACGVFALLSRQTARDVEGFGMVLAEAQACGAPVLAARSGGMPEAVGSGAGIVVAPDAPAQAAQALSSLFNAPDRMAAMGIEGRSYAKGLSWESRADTFASILGNLT